MLDTSNGVNKKDLSDHDLAMMASKKGKGKETNKHTISRDLYKAARANDEMAKASKEEVRSRVKGVKEKIKKIRFQKTMPGAEVAAELADIQQMNSVAPNSGEPGEETVAGLEMFKAASRKKKRRAPEDLVEQPAQAGEINTEIELAEADLIDVEEKPVVSKAAEEEEIWGNKEYEKENEEKMWAILYAYDEAKTMGEFTEWMLENAAKNNGMRLTKKMVEIDPTKERYLKKHFIPRKGLRFDDLLNALPTEQDYLDKAHNKETRKTGKRETVKVVPEKPKAKTLEEVRKDISTVVEKYKEKDPVQAAEEAYVKAYKEYDPRFTEELDDETIIVTRPPWLAIRKAARELKRLYGVMLEARKKMAGEDETIQKTLAAHKKEFKGGKTELKPENIETIKRAAQEEESRFIEANKHLAPKVVKNEAKEFTSPLIERLKGMPVEEGLGTVLRERGKSFDDNLKEIEDYFIEKYKMSDEKVKELLLGEEIKGLFKGAQRQKQKNYKSMINNPVYKEWLKVKEKK